MLTPFRSLPDLLFWAKPLADDSEFSPEDPLALDYLAQQVGLWLFPGFTTRTNRAQYYAVVLYGLHLIDKAERSSTAQASALDEDQRKALYERWERFWALATLESRDGNLGRSDPDSLRGVQGAKRAWSGAPRDQPLPLDYKLISRQDELGSLGAYLSSLRWASLVHQGTLRPTPLAAEIIEAFWDESSEGTRTVSFDNYALSALSLKEKKIARKHSGIKLATLGEHSRLSVLHHPNRKVQQERLWNALFVRSSDRFTLPLAQLLIKAHKKKINKTDEILAAALDGQCGAVDPALVALLSLAQAFGEVFWRLLEAFNHLYGAVVIRGWRAMATDCIKETFADQRLKNLQRACRALLRAPGVQQFRRLEFHGNPFLDLVQVIPSLDAAAVVEQLLHYHGRVQRERRRSDAWLRRDGADLEILLTAYQGYLKNAFFPSLKINVVRSLLSDLGRI